MVVNFLNLPYHVRLDICKRLYLLTEEDIIGRKDETEMFAKAFRKAKEDNILEELNNEICKHIKLFYKGIR